MNRYIDAELLKADIRPFAEYESNRNNKDWVKRVEVVIDDQPTADVRENVKGHWIPQDHNKKAGYVTTTVYYFPKCSRCGGFGNFEMNFCPFCGADMRSKS